MRHARYREWAPAPELAPFIVCSWAGRFAGDGSPYTDRVLPDACIDIVWDGTQLAVAGPDTGPVLLSPRPGGGYAGVRFRPGAAPAVLGLPADELRDRRVPLADLWGDGANTELVDHVAGSARPTEVCRRLEAAVAARLPRAERVDPLVQRLVVTMTPWSRTGAVAQDLGVTERTLHRRVRAAVGYGPKTLQRVVRFRTFLDLGRAEPSIGTPAPGLARLAVRAGYSDQAHLARDCRELADLTPAELVRGPAVRSVQDGLLRSD